MCDFSIGFVKKIIFLFDKLYYVTTAVVNPVLLYRDFRAAAMSLSVISIPLRIPLRDMIFLLKGGKFVKYRQF
jgi:hypothetical protein